MNSCTYEDYIVHNTTVLDINSTNWMLALNHIMEYEGLKLEPYNCNGMNYIGYGHQITSKDNYLLNGISKEYALLLLENDLKTRVIYASTKYKLSGDQALALGMLFYNVKPSSIRKTRLHEELNNNSVLGLTFNNDIVIDSWMSLCKFNGSKHPKLLNRRCFELMLFYNENKCN
jgi:GH24 family phage-related lysozyme (muramidase)